MSSTNTSYTNYYRNLFLNDDPAPQFNLIRNNDFEPALKQGIDDEDKEIHAITGCVSRPTFANTIEKLDSAGALLERVTDIFYNLLSAASDEEKERLAEKFTPLLTAHRNNIMLNQDLFLRVKYVHMHPLKSLSPESCRLIEKTYLGFKRSGALLKGYNRERYRELTTKASQLCLQFQTNLLHARKKFALDITNSEMLAGVPDNVLETAATAAAERGVDGWTLTLDAPVYTPVLTYCDNRELRRTMYMAYNSVCLNGEEDNNSRICKEIANTRMEIAKLLGYDTYADYVLEERMAGSVEKVRKMLDELTLYYLEPARKDVSAVEDFARKTEGNNFELHPWDFAYYSNKLKRSLFNIDSEMLRPYFELNKVKNGIFNLATTLYGIKFYINPDIPAYAPGVMAYDVIDKNQSHLGVLYLDLHPRKGKQGGAWMTSYSPQFISDRTNHRPCVSIVTNFTPPTPQRPSLLTLGEVTTFLHEFGHALHGLMANTTYRSLSGTNVLWDFVELPSQIMENFATEKKFLTTFAVHYKTGEPLPEELLERIKRSRNFNVAYSTMRQVAYGLLDIAFHTITKPIEGDVVDFERKATQQVQLLPTVDDTCLSVQFGHIMSGGYAAGYYSYKWAEMLEADAFSEFREHGTFSKETAERFRNCILSKGDSAHPMELYKQFRGKEPTIDAMLERDGIKKKEAQSQ